MWIAKRCGATRHAYVQPNAVGYAAWWTWGTWVMAFEALDGALVWRWRWRDRQAGVRID